MSRVGRRGAGDGMLEVRVIRDDLGDLVAAINKHGSPKELKKELRRALRESVKPLVPKARAAAMSGNVRRSAKSHTAYRAIKSGKNKGKARAYQSDLVQTTGLRKDIARSVEAKVDLGGRNPGVRLRLNGAKMRTHPAGMVAMFEGEVPWRHPVFDTGRWVLQPHRGFLTEIGTAGAPEVMRKIDTACNDIGKKIDG